MSRPYRVYLKEIGFGREFGIDYTLEEAREAKRTYKKSFPNCQYYIRKAKRTP